MKKCRHHSAILKAVRYLYMCTAQHVRQYKTDILGKLLNWWVGADINRSTSQLLREENSCCSKSVRERGAYEILKTKKDNQAHHTVQVHI